MSEAAAPTWGVSNSMQLFAAMSSLMVGRVRIRYWHCRSSCYCIFMLFSNDAADDGRSYQYTLYEDFGPAKDYLLTAKSSASASGSDRRLHAGWFGREVEA